MRSHFNNSSIVTAREQLRCDDIEPLPEADTAHAKRMQRTRFQT